MHMARLWDSSRRLKGGYSLEALSHDPKVMSGAQLSDEKDLIGKISMKTIFGRKKVKKDGSDGKVTIIDPVEVLQREKRKPWICYSALDSISTLKLYESMKNQLSKKEWKIDGKPEPGTMFNFYEKYWRPFGELLVKMETEGMLVNRDYLAEIEKLAKAEQEIAANRFRRWASRYCPDANYMNVGSDVQLRQLLFGGIANRYTFQISIDKFILFSYNYLAVGNYFGRLQITGCKILNACYFDVVVISALVGDCGMEVNKPCLLASKYRNCNIYLTFLFQHRIHFSKSSATVMLT